MKDLERGHKGHLFVFEGANDVGKTALSRRLARMIKAKGDEVCLTAFPGNMRGTLGKLVHKLHHDLSQYDIQSIEPLSLQLLHVAAHIDAIHRMILPRLQQGIHVVLDRFWWSTLIYGLISGVDRESLEAVLDVEKRHWEGVQPDVLFLVDRQAPFGHKFPEWDKLRQTYLRFAKAEEHSHPVKIIVNDSAIEDVVEEVATTADI